MARLLSFLLDTRALRRIVWCVIFTFFSVYFLVSCVGVRTDDLSIHGRTFYLDGKPFLPKGVDVVAFLYPPKRLATNPLGQAQRRFWGEEELEAAKAKFGANVIRFHVSQAGLDPSSPSYDAGYPAEIRKAVETTQENGLAAIVVMDAQQDETPSTKCMPSARTVRAWKVLTPALDGQPRVMFELFNEPCKPGSPQNKAEWAADMQRLIDTVRSSGATNILLLDGLDWARTTNGLFSLVHERLPNRLAMAVHPYLAENWFVTEAQWRDHFGYSAERFPTIATEWNATPTAGCVGMSTPERALAMARYLQSLDVGLVGWGIDAVWGKIVKDHVRFEPTDYASFTGCSTFDRPPPDSGAGKLLANYPHN